MVVILCNVKSNISINGYRGDVVGTVNISKCEIIECDVAKQCSMFRDIVTFMYNEIEKHETHQFQRTDFA